MAVRRSRNLEGSGVPGKKDDLLALALAQGMTRQAAAEYAGVSPATVYNRLKDPEFVALVEEYGDRLITQALGKLKEGCSDAVDELRMLLKDEDSRVRLGACKAYIAGVVKLGSYDELVRRITVVEERDRNRGGL